jgi:hypothetical protein
MFAGQTVRQTVHLSTLGSGSDTKVRVRLTNQFDPAAATVSTATVALSAGAASTQTAVPLTFAGSRSVTIQPGAEVYSDPVPVSSLGSALGDLTVSLYLANGVAAAAEAPQPAAAGYTATGDQTGDTAGAGTTWTALSTAPGWYLVNGVDVTGVDTTQGTVAVLGDQNALAASATAAGWVDDTPGALSTAGVASPGGFADLSGTATSAAGTANSLGQRLHNRWRLSDGSGTTGADSVGNSALTLTGASWSGTDHPASTTGSAVFAGTSASYGATSGPVIDTSQSFTVSAWVKPGKLGTGNAEVVSTEGTTTSSFMVGYNGGAAATWWVNMPSGDVANPGGTIIKAPASGAVSGVWTHLTAVYDSLAGTVKLYVNGNLAASASGVTGFDATGALNVGRSIWNGAQCDFWAGDIADVEAFQQALPASEVTVLANGGGADLQASNVLNSGVLDEPNLRTVVVALGANDLAAGDTPATVEANLQALATDIKTGLKQYKNPNGTATLTVIVETVPSQGWASTDPRETARQTLNSDLLAFKVSGIDGVEDAAAAAAGAGSTDPATVAAAVAKHLASDVAAYQFAL